MTRKIGLKTQNIPMSSITLSSKWANREVEPENVTELAESIKTVGLLQPIIVRPNGKQFELVAGQHRFEAAKLDGLTTIPASIIEADDIAAELSSLAENLHRLALKDEEWDTMIARWKELYEVANATPPKQGGRPKKSKTGRTPTSFAKHAAKKSGKGVTTIKQGVRRATKLAPEARAAYRAGDVTRGQADELVKLPAVVQKKMLQLVSGKSVTETRTLVKKERDGVVETGAGPSDPKKALMLAMAQLLGDGGRVKELLDDERVKFDERAQEILKLASESKLATSKKSRAFVEDVEALVKVLVREDRGREHAFTELVSSLSAAVEGFTGTDDSRRSYQSRPHRWATACSQAIDALEELVGLKQEYEEWGDNLPDNLRGGSVEDKIQNIVGLDFENALDSVQEAESADLPLGFGRD